MTAPSRGLVLTVDDEATNRYAVSRVLSQAGYKVIEASTGAEALHFIQSERPDLVVLDVRLPDISGYEICRRIKEDPATASTLVLQVSATFVNSRDAVRSLDGGADSYLTQPVEPPVLIATVGALIRLRRAEEALRESESRHRLLFERTPLPAWVFDIESLAILAVNEAAVLRYGYSRDELLAMRIGDLQPPADVAAFKSRAAGDARGQLGVWRHRTKDGNELDVELTAAPIRFGEHRARILIATDVTERRRVEQARVELLTRERTARAQAEEANRAKDDFLATLSHELRTPLNAMVGWVNLLQTGKLDASTAKRGLDAIDRNTRIQAQLIEDLLDVSRIITGKLVLERDVIDLVDVAQAAAEGLRAPALARQLELAVTAEAAPIPVLGDFGRLQQVVSNLVSNAIKFTEPGGRVTVRIERRDSDAVLEVTDTGRGIRPEFLPHVFEKFRQADTSTTRSHAGLGLGLAIVRRLVELHGGRVKASSEGEGHGATFTVTLALAPVAATPGTDRASDKADDVTLDGVSVLLVDDDADSLMLAAVALEQHGARVTTARSGAEALDAMKDSVPDVLVSDLGMPELDGLELMREVRRRRGTTMPALALTAYAMEADAERTRAAGYTMHLSKPLDPKRLARAVRRLAGHA
jgi:PAS domain S-box-containing protein